MSAASPIRTVDFPSHVPELWEQVTGQAGGFEGAVAQVSDAIEAGELVALEHEVSAWSVRHLPDMIRFIDDRLRDGAGLILKGSVPERALPWWHAAIATAQARELPFEVRGDLPQTDAPGLRQAPVAAPALPPRDREHIVECVHCLERPTGPDWRPIIQEMMAHLGGAARFVNPKASLLPYEVLYPWVKIDPNLDLPLNPTLRLTGEGAEPALITAVVDAIETVGATLVTGASDATVAVLGLDDSTAERLRAEGIATHPEVRDAALIYVDMPAHDVVLVSNSAIALERVLADTLGVEPGEVTALAVALEAGDMDAQHAGFDLRGDVPEALLTGPARLVKAAKDKPLTILGIACTTLANHAASLLVDGQLVGSVQEERLRRRKQLGWHPHGRPGETVVSRPRIPIKWSYPKRAIESVLQSAGLTWDDVDVIAYNGIPAHFLPTYSVTNPERPPRTIQAGKVMYIPHHLAHAASTWRVSGLPDACTFTVDGRGERETAAFFEPRDGALHRVFDVLCQRPGDGDSRERSQHRAQTSGDSLIGGVYEYLTTILGFGHHGAGSTMGLAPLGQPNLDLGRFLSARDRHDYSIHDHGLERMVAHLQRAWGDPMHQGHMDLAASAQRALEETVEAFIADGLGGRDASQLCLAGGVALNCAMNQRIRRRFGVKDIFVQPAANDAGTALGAALEAHWEITGEAQPMVMEHAYYGPGFSSEEVGETLKRFGLTAERRPDIAQDSAELVAEGKVVCWFQGKLEFGPRALGARSILSDPRSTDMKARVNTMKGRQWWRPFGPSILAGHEADWFETPFDSRFMLFTVPVREDKQGEIPAVLHVDGTTRPQSVHASHSPAYHAMISHFHALTGVPMVTNTSFNTAFEPIVCTPEDAIASWLQLGADALAIEDWLVFRG
jgi:predicted NodU family carbamoyl transferase